MDDTAVEDLEARVVQRSFAAAARGREAAHRLRSAGWVLGALFVVAAVGLVLVGVTDGDADDATFLGAAAGYALTGAVFVALLNGLGSLCELRAAQVELTIITMPEDE